MTESHPTPEMFAQLLAGTLGSPAAQREVASHLLRRCAVCLRTLRSAADHPPTARSTATPGDVYPELLARGLERTAQVRTAIAGDAVNAMVCWTLLEGMPQARRFDLVRAEPRFHRWQLAQRLIETAADLACDLPAEAADMCRLALTIAEHLPQDRYPRSLGHDLRARAHGLCADALRREGRLREARRAFGRAWLAADQGSGDPLERAALLSLEANLHLTLGDFPSAIAMLRPAAAVFRLHRECVFRSNPARDSDVKAASVPG